MFDLFDMTYRPRRGRSFRDAGLGLDPWGFSSSITAAPAQDKKSPFSVKTVKVDGKNFDEIRLVAPGLKREDFNVDVEDHRVTVSYQLEVQRDYEFASRSASSSYLLPEGVTVEDIKARYEDGILYVRVPIPEKAVATTQRTKIEIE